MASLSVLVIDDDPDNAESLTLLLHLCGCRAILCRSATEVLDAVEREQPDAVVSDLLMPDVDGFELAKLIRRTRRGAAVRLIALTGMTRQIDREAAKEAGFDQVLLKPSSIQQVIEATHA
jgi:CheY-like chemotaxis protein